MQVKTFSLMFSAALMLAAPAKAQGVKTGPECGLTLCPIDDEGKRLLEAEGYKLISVPSDGIERTMPIGTTAAKGIPETVQGIWWITVTPLTFTLASLGGDTTWDPETRTAYSRLYGEGTFSFKHSTGGLTNYLGTLRSHAAFRFRFSDDDKFVSIVPTLELFGQQIPMPEEILRYDMRLVEDGHFVRESWLFGIRLPDYQLRRIVKADGSRDATYSAYLLDADKESFLAVKTK